MSSDVGAARNGGILLFRVSYVLGIGSFVSYAFLLLGFPSARPQSWWSYIPPLFAFAAFLFYFFVSWRSLRFRAKTGKR